MTRSGLCGAVGSRVRRARASVALILVMLACWLVSTPAQVRVVRHGDDRLANVRELDVLVTVEGAAMCGVMKSSLQQQALAALKDHSIAATVSERAPSWFHTLQITVRSAAVQGHCVSPLRVAVTAWVEAVPDADRNNLPGQWGSLLVGDLPLAEVDDLLETPSAQHAAALERAVSAAVRNLAARIRKAGL